MSKKHTTAVIFVLVAAGAGMAYWYSKTTRSQPESEIQPESLQNSPVAKVQTVLLAHRKIEETIVAYGTVAAALGKTQTVSVPFESQVREIMVTPGQVVDVNAPLIDIAPGPDGRFQLEEARTERDTEKNNLDLVTRRLEMKLATRQDLISAQQNFQTAQLKVKNMEEQGIGGQKTILAHSRVLVNQINVSQGQIVPPGTVLIEMINENQLSVHLGVENEDIGSLKPGQPVQLYQVSAPEEKMISGTIGLITQQVDPKTRMIDVFVFPESGAKLLLNEYIKACIVIDSDKGFVVPRSAVLPGDEKYILYTVEKGCAVKHLVTTGLENSEQIQIYGEDLREGQQVVVAGNYELENNMPVKVEQQQ
jgi:RND family efflux transporter MFP subunit